MKILVTGVPGWLGNRFLEMLCASELGIMEKCSVRCLVQPGSAADSVPNLPGPGRVEIFSADITGRPSLKGVCSGVDVVFHAAGLIHPGRPPELFDVNTLGTLNLISEARASGVTRFVYISSNSAAGVNKARHEPLRESDEPRPYMNYGLSKYYAECIVRSFQGTGGMETVILRPCWFYGPNQPRRQSRFFRMIRSGSPFIFGDGFNLRSMSYVDNVCRAMALAALRKEASGRTYWIADARPYTTLEIYSTIAELLGVKRFRPRFLPGFVPDICALADGVLQFAGLYSTEIHVAGEMNKDIFCSVEKAAVELGYKPEVELREGMRRSIEFCRMRGEL